MSLFVISCNSTQGKNLVIEKPIQAIDTTIVPPQRIELLDSSEAYWKNKLSEEAFTVLRLKEQSVLSLENIGIIILTVFMFVKAVDCLYLQLIQNLNQVQDGPVF